MMTDEPYFLSNKDWYIYNEEEFRYELTDKATDEAKKSYKEFYDLLENESTVGESEVNS